MQVGCWGNLEDYLAHSSAVAIAVNVPVMSSVSFRGGYKGTRLLEVDAILGLVIFLKNFRRLEARIEHGDFDTGCLLDRFLTKLLAFINQIVYAVQVFKPFFGGFLPMKRQVSAG